MLASRVRMCSYREIVEYVLATDSEFSGTTNGSFRYIGSDLKIVIPSLSDVFV